MKLEQQINITEEHIVKTSNGFFYNNYVLCTIEDACIEVNNVSGFNSLIELKITKSNDAEYIDGLLTKEQHAEKLLEKIVSSDPRTTFDITFKALPLFYKTNSGMIEERKPTILIYDVNYSDDRDEVFPKPIIPNFTKVLF